MNRTLLLALLAALVATACSPKTEDSAAPVAQTSAPVAAPTAPDTTTPATASASPNTGKVVQIQQAGIYTYAEVDTGTQKLWIAGGHIEAKVDDTVQWGGYAEMYNFTSKALNRTFDQILFVNNWGLEGAAMETVQPHGTPPAQTGMGAHAPMMGHPPMAARGEMPMMAGASSGKVKSVSTAGGYSYLEVDQGGTMVWLAAPEFQVKQGEDVQWAPGMTMRNFDAKSLNRVFDEIQFVENASVVR